MRVFAITALGVTLLATPLTAQAAPADQLASPTAAAAWPSCVTATRTKLNNEGWSDPKWQVSVANRCSSRIKYSIVRDHQSDFDYVEVKAGKTSIRNLGKFSFGHSASQPDGVKIYKGGTRYTKRF